MRRRGRRVQGCAPRAGSRRRHAEFEHRQVELDRRQKEKYQAAIKRRGPDATNARWDRAYSEALEKGRYGLCQWEDEINGKYMGTCAFGGPGTSTAASTTGSSSGSRNARSGRRPPSSPLEGPLRSRRTRRTAAAGSEPKSRWGSVQARPPETDPGSTSPARGQAARDQQLREHPTASHVGSRPPSPTTSETEPEAAPTWTQPNLQSICRRCHHGRPSRRATDGMKRAAERRRRGS